MKIYFDDYTYMKFLSSHVIMFQTDFSTFYLPSLTATGTGGDLKQRGLCNNTVQSNCGINYCSQLS